MFDNKLQHDAQELLRFVLARIQSCAQSRISREDTRTSLSDGRSIDTGLRTSAPTTRALGDLGSGTFSTSRKRLALGKSIPIRKQTKLTTKSSKKLTDFFHRAQATPSQASSTGATILESPNRTACVVNVEPSRQKDTLPTHEPNFIARSFQGELVSQLHCYDCDSLTKRPELFFDVSIPVLSQSLPGFPEGGTPLKMKSDSSGGRGSLDGSSGGAFVGPFSLSWALSQFCYREKLFGDNKYKCENCNHLVEAEKTLLFSCLPRIMTIHLNRFTTHVSSYGVMSGGAMSVTKIGGNLAVPMSLCLSAWCTHGCANRNAMYHLFAVVFHSGGSCSGGHYTACIRGSMCKRLERVSEPGEGVAGTDRNEDGSWFYFDDDYVEEVSLEEVLDLLSPLSPAAQTAYILFYTLDDC